MTAAYAFSSLVEETPQAVVQLRKRVRNSVKKVGITPQTQQLTVEEVEMITPTSDKWVCAHNVRLDYDCEQCNEGDISE